MNIKYINLRKLNNEQIYILRRKVIEHKSSGCSDEDTSQAILVNPKQVQKIWTSYLASGENIKALYPKPCGRKKESGKLLTSDESQSILDSLINSTPEQYHLGCPLWTREAVSKLIKMKFGKTVPVRSISNYLKQWRFSYPKSNVNDSFPIEEYSLLQKRAKSEHATLYWLGVHNISQQEQYVMTQSKWDNSCCIKLIPAQKPVDAFFAIPSKGITRFLVVHDRNKQRRQIDFLHRLMLDSSNPKIIVILDGICLDIGKRMQQFLNRNKERLKIIQLTGCNE